MNADTLGAFDAKNHFSELLEKAANGGETIVTKHGRPVAKIVPYVSEASCNKAVLDRIAKSRAKIAKRGALREVGESWDDLARDGLR